MIDAGTQLPPFEQRLTRENLVRYAAVSGDLNPIHYSDHAARALGLPGVVAHGMMTMGVALRAVTTWLGDPAGIRTYTAHFARAVLVPDDGQGAVIHVEGTVTDVTEDTATVTLVVTCRSAGAGDAAPVLTRVTVTVGR